MISPRINGLVLTALEGLLVWLNENEVLIVSMKITNVLIVHLIFKRVMMFEHSTM